VAGQVRCGVAEVPLARHPKVEEADRVDRRVRALQPVHQQVDLVVVVIAVVVALALVRGGATARNATAACRLHGGK